MVSEDSNVSTVFFYTNVQVIYFIDEFKNMELLETGTPQGVILLRTLDLHIFLKTEQSHDEEERKGKFLHLFL